MRLTKQENTMGLMGVVIGMILAVALTAAFTIDNGNRAIIILALVVLLLVIPILPAGD